MLDLGNLFFKLSVNTKDLKRAEKDLKSFVGNVKKDFKSVSASVDKFEKSFSKAKTRKVIEKNKELTTSFQLVGGVIDKSSVNFIRLKSAIIPVSKSTQDYSNVNRGLIKTLNQTNLALNDTSLSAHKAALSFHSFADSNYIRDVGYYASALDSVGSSFNGAAKSGQSFKTFISESADSIERFTKRALSLRRAAHNLMYELRVPIAATAGLIALSDQYAILQQRLKTATKETKNYFAVSDQIYKISQKTGTPLKTNIKLYQNMARVAPDMKKSSAEVLILVDAINKLAIIGGSTTDQLKYGMLQFTQAMSMGVVHAEEMNSIIENLPEVASRIAHGMRSTATGTAMTVAELRNAVKEGRVLSTDIMESLMRQVPKISEDFKDIAPSIQRSGTTLVNSFTKFIGELGKSSGITKKIADEFQRMSGFFDNVNVQDFWSNLKKTSEYLAVISGSSALVWGLNKAFLANAKGTLTWASSLLLVKKTIKNIALGTFIGMIIETGLQINKLVDISNGWENAFANIGDTFKAGWNNLKRWFAKQAPLSSEVINKTAAKFWKDGGFDMEGYRKEIARLKEERNKEWDAFYDAEAEKINDGIRKRSKSYEELFGGSDGSDSGKLAAEIKEQQELLAAMDAGLVSPSGEGRGSKADPFARRAEQLVKSLSTEEELIWNGFMEQMTIIHEAEQMKYDLGMSYDELTLRAREDFWEKMNELDKKGSEASNGVRALAAITGVNIQKKIEDDNIEENGQRFMKLLNNASEYSKELFGIMKAAAIASATLESAQAVMSAFAFGNKIAGPELGYVFAGIAAGAAAIYLGGITAATIEGKAMGGPVSAGKMYEVGEKGPEILSTGGRNYLLPGKGGNVTPNHQLSPAGGGSSNVIVNVHNNTDTNVRIEKNQGNGSTTIDVIMEKVENYIAGRVGSGQGPITEALQGGYGLGMAVGDYN